MNNNIVLENENDNFLQNSQKKLQNDDNDDNEDDTLVVVRVHHAIADGFGFVPIVEALFTDRNGDSVAIKSSVMTKFDKKNNNNNNNGINKKKESCNNNFNQCWFKFLSVFAIIWKTLLILFRFVLGYVSFRYVCMYCITYILHTYYMHITRILHA